MRGTLNQKKAIKLLVQDGWTQIRGRQASGQDDQAGLSPDHTSTAQGAGLSNWLGPGDSQAGGAKMKELHPWS